MKKYLLPFFIFWFVNSIILYLAVLIMPAYFVLGSSTMTVWGGVFVAGFTWTLIVWLLKPFIFLFKKLKGTVAMFVFYLVLNFVALWLTARLGPIVGFGTTRFIWLIPVAIVANIVQYLIWKVGGVKKLLK
jgi:uncharacterized membrane protein YvlD (DUF360 family)